MQKLHLILFKILFSPLKDTNRLLPSPQCKEEPLQIAFTSIIEMRVDSKANELRKTDLLIYQKCPQ